MARCFCKAASEGEIVARRSAHVADTYLARRNFLSVCLMKSCVKPTHHAFGAPISDVKDLYSVLLAKIVPENELLGQKMLTSIAGALYPILLSSLRAN